MFLSAAVFAAIVAAIAGFLLYGSRENRRILATGRSTIVSVLSKHKSPKGGSSVVEIRMEEDPEGGTFFRTLLGEEWERAQPGGSLPYVYDPADPRGGVLGDPRKENSIPCFLAAGSVFIVPFLVIGIALKVRERKVRTPS